MNKLAFLALATMVLIGVFIYLQISFQGADVKTAIRLVEEAKASGITLGRRMGKHLPLKNRYCEASSVNQFYGHMEVVCRDLKSIDHQLKWKVNVIDGQVAPANEAAIKLGKGESPWS